MIGLAVAGQVDGLATRLGVVHPFLTRQPWRLLVASAVLDWARLTHGIFVSCGLSGESRQWRGVKAFGCAGWALRASVVGCHSGTSPS